MQLLLISYICLCQFSCLHLSPLCYCVWPAASTHPLLRLMAGLVWLPVHIPAPASDAVVIQRAGGGRPSRCAESENYYPSFKDRLRCCTTGIPLCSRSMTQCLLAYPECKCRQSTSSHPCVVVLWELCTSKTACLLPPDIL